MCFKMIKWKPSISYISLNSTHITSQRLKSTFLSPPVHHSSTAYLTYTDIAPAIICFHRLLINHIWKILWSHLPAHFLSKEKQPRVIRHFHFHGWPEVGIPAEGKGMIDIIASVQRQQQQSGNHPIIVHCRYLGTHLSLLHPHTGICVLHMTVEFFVFVCAAVLVQGEQVRSLHWAISWSESRQKACWTCSKLWRVYACRGLIWSKLW